MAWSCEQTSERDVEITIKDGEAEHVLRFRFDVLLYRGVCQAAATYTKGDMVTDDGSVWHCNVERPTARPGAICAQWTLAAKHGCDLRE